MLSCIDETVKFPGLETFSTPSYVSKQIVSREIELEKMRKRMPPAELNNATAEIDKFDENEKSVSTPKSVKG